MKFASVASGSKGNSYVLHGHDGHKVLLELGIPWEKILLGIDFRSSDVDFALVSHQHGDHASPNTVRDALRAGIDIYMSAAVAEFLCLSGHHRAHILMPGEQQKVGSWTILPFELQHDVPCLGAVIAQGDERLLFIPDTGYVKNRFHGITMIAAEANFVDDILSGNILNGSLPAVVGHRVRRNHLSLQVLVDMFKSNDFSNCREIHLLHLSDGNSDEKRMVREVQEAIGIPCYAA